MKIRFKSNKLKKQLRDASEIKKGFGAMAKKVSIRMSEIIAAPNLALLIQLPGPRCHALLGARLGDWAVTISANHRLIFKIDHDPIPINANNSVDAKNVTDIEITGTEDYH